MTDKDKKSYWKGYNDSKKPDVSIPTTICTGGRYNPQSGDRDAYRAGWDKGKSEKK